MPFEARPGPGRKGHSSKGYPVSVTLSRFPVVPPTWSSDDQFLMPRVLRAVYMDFW